MLDVVVQSAHADEYEMVEQPVYGFVLVEHDDELNDGGNVRRFEEFADKAQLRKFQENPFVCLLFQSKPFHCGEISYGVKQDHAVNNLSFL